MSPSPTTPLSLLTLVAHSAPSRGSSRSRHWYQKHVDYDRGFSSGGKTFQTNCSSTLKRQMCQRTRTWSRAMLLSTWPISQAKSSYFVRFCGPSSRAPKGRRTPRLLLSCKPHAASFAPSSSFSVASTHGSSRPFGRLTHVTASPFRACSVTCFLCNGASRRWCLRTTPC